MGRGGGNIIPKKSPVCQEMLSVQTPMYFLKGAVENFGVSPIAVIALEKNENGGGRGSWDKLGQQFL